MPPTRKQVMDVLGFELRNCQWSWSAVNHVKKQVMFFPWDCYLDRDHFDKTKEKRYLILHDSWATKPGDENTLQRGYTDAINNLNLTINEGFELTVMFQTPTNKLDYPKSSEIAEIRSLHSRSYFNAKLSRAGEGYFATLITRYEN